MKHLPVFVYGTLRTGFENYDILDLRTAKTKDGIVLDCSMYAMKGKKYEFPAVVMDNSKNSVYGELMWIKENHYLAVMKELDHLEGYNNNPDTDLYDRIEVSVLDPDSGEDTTAWMYVAGKNMASYIQNECDLVDDGDWEVYTTLISDTDFDEDEPIEDTLAREDEDDWGVKDTKVSGSLSLTPRTNYTSVQPAKKTTTVTKSAYYMDKRKENEPFIWYVCYGSNLNAERFLKYMNVGRYGDNKFTEDDLESVQVQVPHGIYFAKSGRWGSGGIAFIDVDTTEDWTCAMRAYKLSIPQFWSLVCQENGSRNIKLDWDKMQNEKFYDAPQIGLYTRVTNLGSIDGVPAFTVTNSESYASMLSKEKTPVPYQFLEMGMLNPPSREYLNTINEGAEQTAALPHAELKAFVPKPKVKSKGKGNKPGKTAAPKKNTAAIVPGTLAKVG